jgi:phosphoglycolate phosphatase-like HAD superfamily hydrolase
MAWHRPRLPLVVLLAVVLVALAVLSGRAAAQQADDPLPSWSDGPARQAILDFVANVTDADGPGFIPPEGRIATFDNDGTLWVEKPTYVQVTLMFDRLHRIAPDHPEWRAQDPFRAVLDNDQEALSRLTPQDVLTLAGAAYGGQTMDTFYSDVADALASARHPRFDRPHTELVYQPMLELMDFLRDNDFHVFIVSGGGRDFIRVFSEEIYGVARDDVVGSALQARFEPDTVGGHIVKQPDLVQPVDDGPGKPVHIQRTIGRRPVFAAGNSNGDIEMLRFAESDGRPWLALLVHHDDADREYAYDHGTEQALQTAADRGWTVVSMRDDWRRVFPFDSE